MANIMIFGVRSNRLFSSGGAALRGGNWNNGTNAGAFALNLNNSSSNTNTNIGFRCVFLALADLRTTSDGLSIITVVDHFSRIKENLKALRFHSWANRREIFPYGVRNLPETEYFVHLYLN